jgi:hypothetical protein
MGLLDASAPYLYPLCGLALMLVTWPMAGAGRRVLLRWSDITEPDRDQVAVVVRYLRKRRLLVLPLMLLAPLTARAIPAIVAPANDLGSYHLLGSLLVASLLAELLATVPHRSGARRTERDRRDGTPRPLRDIRPQQGSAGTTGPGRRGCLVPRWAVGLQLGLAAVAVVFAVVAQPWVGGWYLIVLALVTSLVVHGIAWLAMVRPAGDRADVDTALRIRSARVAVGVGILVAGLLVAAGGNRLVFAEGGWIRMAASAGVATLTVAALLGWGGVIASPRRASFV